MQQGVIKGYFNWGMNPCHSAPNAGNVRRSMANLDWLGVADQVITESASFWNAPDMNPSEIDTTVYYLPCALIYEKPGIILNSSRWIQYRYQAVEPWDQAKPDYEMCDLLWTAICDLYKKEGGANPDPILKTKWDYYVDGKIDPRPVAWALNGYRIAGTECNTDSANPKTDLLKGYAELGADGSTACAMWIYSGMWNNNDAPLDPAEQPLCCRNTEDKSGIGLNSEWAFSWPSNRRILYNRNSCDMQGKPWNEDKKLMEWNGEKWILVDQADFVAAKDGKPVPPNNRPSSCCGSRTPAWRATAWSTARCPSISSRSSRRATTTRSTARSATRAHSARSTRPRSRAPRSSTRSLSPRTPLPSIGRPAARRVCARRWWSPCRLSSSR